MKRVWVCLLCAVLAGCGGAARKHTVTVPAYGEHPATTVSASPASPAACAADARIFARDAVLFVAHSSANAAYPADLYYMDLREDFAGFEAGSCEPTYLGTALRARLTPAQRATLVAGLPTTFAHVLRTGLAVTHG